MAEKVTLWKAQDGSLHLTEEVAVEHEISVMGEDVFYDMIVDRINNAYGERKSFRYREIPQRITYRLIEDGYVAVLNPLVSNADLPEQYNIDVYKRGIQPKSMRNMIIKAKSLTS